MSLLAEQVGDLYRLHAPARTHEVPARAAALAALPAAALPAHLAALEAEHAAPRFFSHGAYNFLGRGFDARAALYDEHVVPPVPCAVPLDNLHKASILLPAAAGAAAAAAAPAATGRLHGAEAEARDQRQGTLLDWAAGELPAAGAGPLGALRALRDAGAMVTVLLLGCSGGRGGEEVRGRLRGIDSSFNALVMDAATGALVLLPGARVQAIRVG